MASRVHGDGGGGGELGAHALKVVDNDARPPSPPPLSHSLSLYLSLSLSLLGRIAHRQLRMRRAPIHNYLQLSNFQARTLSNG